MQSGYRGDELPLTINLIPILCLRENVNQKGGLWFSLCQEKFVQLQLANTF